MTDYEGKTTDYETMTTADLVAAILAGAGCLKWPANPYRAEFARRARPQDWPDGDPVQAALGKIRQQEPAGAAARLLAVAEIAAHAHRPSTRGKCCTCREDRSVEPDAEQWPCDPYLNILLALNGAQEPVQGELVRSELPSASSDRP
jgi:hypothetical protein